jgi:murein DD-endopeptidase MepM/ murein hydrolase activator NlpD
MPKLGKGPTPSPRSAKASFRIIIARGEHVRAFTVRPWLAASAAVIGMAFGLAYLVATSYLFLRDDVVASSIANHAEIRQTYENRIATLRSSIERLTSRQAVDQRTMDAKLERLLDRQAALDARQDVIATLSQAMRRAGLVPGPARSAATASPATSPEASDADKKPLTTGSIDTPLKLASFVPRGGLADDESASTDARMAAVESSLDQLAQEQVAFVDSVASRAAQKSLKIEAVLARLGHPVGQAKLESADGIGGPFVPLAVNADPDTFRSAVELVTSEVENLATLRRTATSLPLARPIANAAVTSKFGARLDPFLGRPALHTGVDFRAAPGFPIRSTAAGTVVTAAFTGGYGNMVEIDHGNGLTTRYAHLSLILVHAGEVIPAGTIVGRAGSTGRSTGPHVHYEIRVDGEAIDPMQYIRAGNEIGAVL